ncbi:Hypothetical predicted protein [Lecanosticta acicola]|uniref:DUF2423 domain-containing protein n=1 Tax=Lecanosticta acicola TaxID=111012 RepID=A0AAI8YW11_9PEZI|nr:Hypothetical predicted protein [Lecanosticta acicola]
MAKSARASRIKKNNQALKKRVFDPVETARNERLSAKLLELAKAPKEKEQETEVEKEAEGTAEPTDTKDEKMDVDENGKPRRSNREIKRQHQVRAARIVKTHKKPRNQRHFPTHGSKKKGSKR